MPVKACCASKRDMNSSLPLAKLTLGCDHLHIFPVIFLRTILHNRRVQVSAVLSAITMNTIRTCLISIAMLQMRVVIGEQPGAMAPQALISEAEIPVVSGFGKPESEAGRDLKISR